MTSFFSRMQLMLLILVLSLCARSIYILPEHTELFLHLVALLVKGPANPRI